jgi:tripeptidyl-peptidase-1
MGVTFLFSSGDDGVAGGGALCLNADGDANTLHTIVTPDLIFLAGSQTSNGTIFNPDFPGTCPYVTAVGATQVSPGHSVWEPESACEEVIYSGGGFSNYFRMPDYQKAAVEEYLTTYPISYPKNIYNSTGVYFLTVSSRDIADSFVVPRVS